MPTHNNKLLIGQITKDDFDVLNELVWELTKKLGPEVMELRCGNQMLFQHFMSFSFGNGYKNKFMSRDLLIRMEKKEIQDDLLRGRASVFYHLLMGFQLDLRQYPELNIMDLGEMLEII